MSSVLTPISLRQSLNRPIHSLNVPIFATLPGINSKPLHHSARRGGNPVLLSVPCGDAFSPHVEPNCLQLRIVFHCVRSKFAAESRTLISAEWKRRIHQAVRINPNRSRLQAP